MDQQEKLKQFPLQRDSWEEFFEYLIESYAAGIGRFEQDLPDVYETQPTQLYAPILEMLRRAEQRVLISAPYLVPDQTFIDLLTELEGRGVEVTLLTNSLASNNHMVAQMAFRPWRRELLDIDVDLFEARDDSVYISEYSTPPTEPGFLGLHSKAIVVDDYLSFIGSPNIDPRSLVINTEVGFFIESEDLAARVAALIERDISPDAAWRVIRDERGRLRWESSAGIVKSQPALGFKQRLAAFFIGLLLPLRGQA
jgi:putative cardiolipin synthase